MASITVPDSVPSPEEDSEQLRKAFAGWGTNEDLIISILGHRNAAQRKVIRDTYSAMHEEDLLKALDKELSSDFERIILIWVLGPAERDAFLANEATKMMSSGNFVLMEIACTRSSRDLLRAREAYIDRFKKSLEEDVADHTTGDIRKLLVLLVSAYRYEGDEVNMRVARSEAKDLHEKISEKAYNDDDVIRIVTTRGRAQLIATLDQYNTEYGNPIEKDLEGDLSNDFLNLLAGAFTCLTCPEKYFEKLLRDAVGKMGTDEWALTRVVATRAEVDMQRIKEEYQKVNGVALDQAIAKDVSGDYENMLLALIGH